MSAFRIKEPRAKSTLEAECYAHPRLFLPYEQLNKAERREFDTNGPIPCEGGGTPGEWCNGCRFGGLQTIEVEILKRSKETVGT